MNGRRALRESLLDLRYLPFLWLVAMAVANERGRRLTFGGIAVIVLLWTLDGAVQALTGWSLGGHAEAERVSGIFGADNLKLGPTLAVLSPFALWAARRRWGSAPPWGFMPGSWPGMRAMTRTSPTSPCRCPANLS